VRAADLDAPARQQEGARPAAPASRAELAGPARLADFFAPRSVAVVGASNTSAWARFVAASARAVAFAGPLIPVHPVHETVFGTPAVRSLRELTAPVDLAFILVPQSAVEDVLDDAAAAGIRGAIVLASEYREAGPEGRAREEQLAARAAAHRITVLGPNCLGFVNMHASVAPFALTVPPQLQAGPVGIALQSGALASAVLGFARSRAIGVSTLVTLGNEAMVTASDVLEYLVADDRTRVMALFLEQIGDPASFARAAASADRAGKPIVALKAGSSAAGQQAALSHTGAVTGDDAVVDAVLRQLNVIRVTSIEELLTTAALLGYSARPRGRRMGALTASGGACDLIADRASAAGIEMRPFAEATRASIAPYLPPGLPVPNPLDVTGHFLADQRTDPLTPIDHALEAALADPGLDFVLFCGVTLPETRPPIEAIASLAEQRVAWIGVRIASAPVPVVPISTVCVDLTEYQRGLLTRHGVHPLGGIDLGVRALGHALGWAEGRGSATAWAARRSEATSVRHRCPPGDTGGASVRQAPISPDGRWSEASARELLGSFGVPVVPAEVVNSSAEAVRAAERLGFPVALKACSPQILHKSDIGAVTLGIGTAEEVRAAYARTRAAGERAAPGGVDGVLVAAMRGPEGLELFAGVRFDPTFGPVLAVGLGGIWIEVLGDVSLRVLPVDAAEVRKMLSELRGLPLLTGARGHAPADLDALAGVVAALAYAAGSLGSTLRSVEVNPLWVNGNRIEALDALVVTEGNGAP
jgi:acetate---CoA ligase (ADP-forming)